MKLGNLVLLWFCAVVVLAVAGLMGWGLSFAFTYNVFVPWLGCVPSQYHNLAAFISAFFFDGIGAIIVLVVFALFGIGCYKLCSRRKRG